MLGRLQRSCHSPCAVSALSEATSGVRGVGWGGWDCPHPSHGASPPSLPHFEPPLLPPGRAGCRCIVKITGEMVLSFPAGITRHFANNPAPAVLTFRVLNFNRLEHVLPNPQLLCW